MGEEIAISLQGISKCFKQYEHPVERLKELLLPGKSRAKEFWALRNIDLEVPRGQTLGVVGRNGSGKSTLLQIIAGTLTPTTGEIYVDGRVSALLELGSGFNPEFTGRQNVFFNGQLLGLSHRELEDKFEEIAGFADIGEFIDQPVKTYSSGMFVRLAFAVAVNVEPEILIVDEALAVGDVIFQHRCLRRMRNLMDSGVTTLFVSHDSGAIKTLCTQAIMLHDGRLQTSGSPNTVIINYMKILTELELDRDLGEIEVAAQEEIAEAESQEPKITKAAAIATPPEAVPSPMSNQKIVEAKLARRGSRRALIEEVQLLNQSEEYLGETPTFGFNEQVTLLVGLKVYQPLQECIIGFFVCDKNGNEVIGSNTLEETSLIGKLEPGEQLYVKFKFNLPLRPGFYSLTIAGSENYSTVTFDWIDNAIIFQVLPPDTGKKIHALVDLPITVEICPANLLKLFARSKNN